MKKVIEIKEAPAAIGAYSQGIEVGNMIFLSGQLPINPLTNEVPQGIEAQTRQALDNVKALLTSQGLDMSDVVKTSVFIANIDDFAVVNQVYSEYFKAPYPARSAFEVSRLVRGMLIEIEVIAVRP